MDNLVGRMLGPYQIVEEIGHSEMGTVFKANQPWLKRHVTIKVLHTYLARDQQFLTDLRHAVQAASKLQHPSIVYLYDFRRDDGIYYLVAEYVEGISLSEKLDREKLPSPTATVPFITQIASALDYAHSQDVTHGGLKPSNILLTPDGRIVLSDFSLAKAASQSSTASLDTLKYLSPEQARGEKKIDHRADIYALGAVLYRLLTGRAPFEGADRGAIIRGHLEGDPVPPSRLNAGVSEEVDKVVLKALAKEPEQRYQRAGELAAAFREAVLPGQRGVEGRGLARLVGAAVALATVVIVVLALAWLRWRVGSTVTPIVRVTELTPTQTASGLLKEEETPIILAPTSTLIPTSTPLIPTDTLVPPTITRLPTAIPSSPTPKPPTATPQPSPMPIAYPIPILVAPPDGAQFGKGNIVLEWQWDGELGLDEYFDVRVWREGKPHYGIAWEKKTSHAIDPHRWPASTYYWAIAVIRGKDGRWEADLSPESAVWTFTWTGGAGPSKPEPPYPPPPKPPPPPPYP